MSDVPTIARDLVERAESFAAAAIEEWKKQSHQERWLAIPISFTFDSLPELVKLLVRAALLEPDRPEAQRDLVDIAVKHGQDRFREGFDETLIYREYPLLRSSMWAHIRNTYGASGAGAEAIIRIDCVTTVAARASLIGFHKVQLDERGSFDAAYNSLLEGWPRLGR